MPFVQLPPLPPWATVLLILWLQIPAVRAFPPSARCAALSLQLTAAFPSSSISTTFRYPGLTLGEGLSNMHTLERLETIGDGSYFRIRHVGTPMRYGEYVTVGVKCAVRGQNHTLLVLSRPDQAHTASLLCLRDNVQRAAFTLRASRLQPGGHALLLDTTFFEDKRVLHRDLRPVMRFLAFYGDRAARSFEPHPNLAWYRRMVLGLPPSPAV
jgi:hypothetical protein